MSDPARIAKASRSVYFVGGGGLVKIGVANDPKSRLAELSVGSPVKLSLLATIDGDRELERTLHEAFAEERSHGEWFRMTPRIEALIEAAKAYMHHEMIELIRISGTDAVKVTMTRAWFQRTRALNSSQRARIVGHLRAGKSGMPVGVTLDHGDVVAEILQAVFDAVDRNYFVRELEDG